MAVFSFQFVCYYNKVNEDVDEISQFISKARDYCANKNENQSICLNANLMFSFMKRKKY